MTFVLGHDTHGHAEESKTAYSGSLATGNNLFNLHWIEFVGGGVGTPWRQLPSRVPARLTGCPVRGGEESS